MRARSHTDSADSETTPTHLGADAPVRIASVVRSECPRTDKVAFVRHRKTAWECALPGQARVGTALAISPLKASQLTQWRTAMSRKVETLMLQSLFGSCVLICAISLAGMLLA